jgi:hypothetical protein
MEDIMLYMPELVLERAFVIEDKKWKIIIVCDTNYDVESTLKLSFFLN